MKINFLSYSFALYSICLFNSATPIFAALSFICTDDINEESAHVCDFGGANHEAYLRWYDSNHISLTYPNRVYMPGADPSNEDGVAIYWNIDSNEEYVHIAVAARAKGWIAFGISESGGMIGADMVLFTAKNPNELVDAYTTDILIPQTDECSSDWELISSSVFNQEEDSKSEDGNFLMFETKRLLNTGDPQDKVIQNDASSMVSPHRVIAAWGNTKDVSYHNLNRARGAIRFFGSGDEQSTFEAVMNRDSEGVFEIRSNEYTVSQEEETVYEHICFSREDLINQGIPDTPNMLNIIGFEPIITEATRKHVHHFIVLGSTLRQCSEDFDEFVFVWAPGEGPLALPENIGSPLFGEDGFQSFLLQIHYDNPKFETGIIDSSGVRFYWTSQNREEELGVLKVGDPNLTLIHTHVGNGLALHQFECPGDCSSAAINTPSVTVLREHFHMHQSGKRMVNEQIRDGQVVRSGAIDYFDFDQNGNLPLVQDPFDILPGDGFRTSCYYSNEGNSKTRIFGYGSRDEMCIAFLLYYPRKHIDVDGFSKSWECGIPYLSACSSTHNGRILSSDDDMKRMFGRSCTDKPGSPDESSSLSLNHGSVLSVVTFFLINIFIFV